MISEQPSQLSFRYEQDPLDVYEKTLEEIRYLKRYDIYTKKMARETHFDIEEIQSLILIYYRIVTRTEKWIRNSQIISKKLMSNSQFISVLTNTFDMTDTELTNNIVAALDQKTGGMKITKTVWLKMLSLFLKGDIEEKIDFCFSVYDTMKTGFLSREILFGYLKNAFYTADGKADEESTRDMIDILMKKLDLDKDGKISHNDYKQAVLRQPCLLEFLGQCVPDRIVCIKLLATLKVNVPEEE